MLLQLFCYLAQQGQFDVDPGPEPCAQVRGAGEDVTEPLVPHELPASLLDQTLHLKREGNTMRVCFMCTILALLMDVNNTQSY